MQPKQAAKAVCRRLERAGFVALFAGGCVRDMLLGRRPKDYDIATNATPRQVIRLFPRSLKVGVKFGIVMVLTGGHRIEVATFRSDSDYPDGRRPRHVHFSDPRSDALRRDFTINGMFQHPGTGKILDFVEGQKDLKRRILRTIGPAEERFAEDHLRLIRAVRFAARFNLKIEKRTYAAIGRLDHKISRVSPERIREELKHILTDPNAETGIKLLNDTGLLKRIVPEITQPLRAGAMLRDKPLTFAGALAALIVGGMESHDNGRRAARKILARIVPSNHLRKTTLNLLRDLPKLETLKECDLADCKLWMQSPHFPDLLLLGDRAVEAGFLPSDTMRKVRTRITGIDPHSVDPPPLLTGEDIKKLGLAESPLIGRILARIRTDQLNEKFRSKPEALQRAKEYIKNAEDGNTNRKKCLMSKSE